MILLDLGRASQNRAEKIYVCGCVGARARGLQAALKPQISFS